MNTWKNWCALRGEQPIPASPTIIANFIKDIAPLGIDRVWPAVLEISRAHYTVGLPDPVSSYPVTQAMNDLAKIPPPRSWPAEERLRFLTLPFDLQRIISKREADRDRQIRHMQNEFAQLKKEAENADNKTTAAVAAA
jgi:hypothetical protein